MVMLSSTPCVGHGSHVIVELKARFVVMILLASWAPWCLLWLWNGF